MFIFGWIDNIFVCSAIVFGCLMDKKCLVDPTKLFHWFNKNIWLNKTNFKFNQPNFTKQRFLLSQWNNFVGTTKHFFVHITAKYYGWTNENVVDSVKYFSECVYNKIE